MSLETRIIEGMRELDEDLVIESAKEAIAQNVDRLTLIHWLNLGVTEVGKLYESEEYFIIELIMSEIIYKKVLELDGFDIWQDNSEEKTIGCMVLGTVNGDNHDIGKNIFKSMVQAIGMKVYDLGVDVPIELFLDAIREHQPDILALSGVLTTALDEMKKLVDRLVKENLRDELHVLIGGPMLSDSTCAYLGADACVTDASLGVEICKVWAMEKQGK